MQFDCPYCKERLDVDEELVGTSVSCPTCSKPVLATEGSGFETLGRIFFEEEKLDEFSEPRVPHVKLEAGQTIGMCRIEKELGKGGMGTVYLARHTRLDVPVALKILPLQGKSDDPEFVDRFLREARLAARIHHPNVVSVKDVDQDAKTGFFYIVQEFVDGGSLGAVLKKEGALEVRRAVEIAMGITEALVEADERKIIHRDIKPDNILLTEKGQPKLADLGLAKEMVSEPENATISSTTMGTPNYMSVEQVQDAGRVDNRTDIYSMGATFFHMLTGSTPYKGKSTFNIINNVVNQPTPDPRNLRPEIPSTVAAICMKAMAKERKQRYQSAKEMLSDLTRVRRGETDPANLVAGDLLEKQKRTREDYFNLRWPSRKRNPAIIRGVWAVVAVVMILGAVFLFHKMTLPENLKKGLVLHYTFNRNNEMMIPDKSGRKNDGKVSGTTWIKKGMWGGALGFFNEQDKIDLGKTLDVGSAWSMVTRSKFPLRKPGRNKFNQLLFSPSNHAPLLVTHKGELGSYMDRFYPFGVRVDELTGWHDVAVVISNQTTTFYIDSKEVGKIKKAVKEPIASIGNQEGKNQAWGSYLDELMVYDRALSQPELRQIYLLSDLKNWLKVPQWLLRLEVERDIVIAWRGIKDQDEPWGSGGTFMFSHEDENEVLEDEGLVCMGGRSWIPDAGKDIFEQCTKKNEFTLEISFTPENLTQDGPARIISFSLDEQEQIFSLGQRRNKLTFFLRTSKTDRHGEPEIVLCDLEKVKNFHIVITYRSGELSLYINGERKEVAERKGDFINWDEAHQVVLGNEVNGSRGWRGTIHSLYILKRFLNEEEAMARF